MVFQAYAAMCFPLFEVFSMCAAATDCSRSFSQILVFNIHGRIGSGFLFAAAGYRNRTRIIIGK